MARFNYEDHFFVREKKWKAMFEKDWCIPEPPSVVELQNGVVLPLHRRKDKLTATVANAAFEGGVCDENGNFVAGIYRRFENPSSNLSVTKAYPFPRYIEARHETVVFGGILYGHFGHVITDTMSRLWWLADHPDTPYKLIFLDTGIPTEFKYYSVLEAAGLTKDRIEIINRPTQFDRIIIPEETFHMLSKYRPEMGKIYDYIQSRVEPGIYKKIYLSRTAFEKEDTYNEEYFENFFQRRGYEIIHPEQLPFDQQVSLMAGAEEVVTTPGTLAHLTHFCKPGTRIVALTRTADVSNILCGFEGRKFDYYIVDISFNFLPTYATGDNIYFLAPTNCWKEYLDANGIVYDPEELSVDVYIKPYVYDYVKKWGQKAAQVKTYNAYHNRSTIDLLDDINKVFLGQGINRKLYPDRDDIVKLKKENAELKKQFDLLERIFESALAEHAQKHPIELQKEAEPLDLSTAAIADQLQKEVTRLEKKVKNMEKSISWRITRPLRALKSFLIVFSKGKRR